MVNYKNKTFIKEGDRQLRDEVFLQGHLLVEVTQHQEHALILQINDENFESLSGPVDKVRWSDLEFATQTVIDAICRVGVVSSEDLFTEALIVKSVVGFNPAIQLRSRSPVNDAAVEKIRAIVESVLQGVLSGPSDGTADAIFQEIPSDEAANVRHVVQEALIKRGGRIISQPIGVFVDQKPVARLQGKYASRPDLSDFNAVPKELAGHMLGFDVAEEALIFQSDGQGKIYIRYGKQDIDLIAIAQMSKSKKHCSVRTHQTTARGGQAIHAFVNIVEFL